MNLLVILCLGRTLAHTLLFPYSNKCLAMFLSKETSVSFGNDFVDIFENITKAVKIMLEEKQKDDGFTDMNDKNEGKVAFVMINDRDVQGMRAH